jgi:hypothetical protein
MVLIAAQYRNGGPHFAFWSRVQATTLWFTLSTRLRRVRSCGKVIE